MAGQRRPMSVNLANPKNHYTKAQVADREAQEAKVPRPKSLKCPGWLSSGAAKLFRGYAKDLIAFLPASTLDTSTLARMCDAEWSYAEASRHKSSFLSAASKILAEEAAAGAPLATGVSDTSGRDCTELYAECQLQVAYWSKQMSTFERIARGAANDLGCTISSRCRLVVPQAGNPEEADPFEQLQRELMHIV